MAFQQRDFNFQGQVPTASIIQAYQNKAAQEMQGKQIEQQAKQQKLQETLGIIQQASQLVQQGVGLSKMRQEKDTKRAFAELIQSGNDYSPSSTMTPGKSSFMPEGTLPIVPKVQLNRETPEWKANVESQLFQQNPQEYSKQMINKAFAEPEDPLKAVKTQSEIDKNVALAKAMGTKEDNRNWIPPAELRQIANKQGMEEMAKENKYGSIADPDYAAKVKQRQDEIFKEMMDIQLATKKGNILLKSPLSDEPLEMSLKEWKIWGESLMNEHNVVPLRR